MRKQLLALSLAAATAVSGTALAETIGDPNVVNNGTLTQNSDVFMSGRIGGEWFMNMRVPVGKPNAIRANNNTFQSLLGFYPLGRTTSIANFYIENDYGAIAIQDNPDGTPNNNVILRGGDTAISFFNGGNVGFGTPSPTEKVHVIGNARIEGTGTVQVLEITGGADLAEQFHSVDEAALEPGTVVAIDAENAGALKLSTNAYDRTVAGIVSGANGLNTGMTMGQKGHEITGGINVALTGRVYVKAEATKGAITPGTLLTTSDIAGHAMAVTDHAKAQGAIIGKAMTSLEEGTGMVLVLVSLQ